MSAIQIAYAAEKPSFWSALFLTGVGLRFLCYAALYMAMGLQPLALSSVAPILATDMFIALWQTHRYNTACGLYWHRTGRFWPLIAGYAVFAGMMIGMVIMWVLLFQGADKSRDILKPEDWVPREQTEPYLARYKVKFSRDGREMFFAGVMSEGSALQLETMMDAAPQLQTLHLDSPGGNLYEARSFAQRVKRLGLDTHISKECSASCILVFAAGQNRTLGFGAEMGFHRYGLDFEQLQSDLNIEREISEDRLYLAGEGINPEFLDTYFNRDRSKIWYPERDQILSSGLIRN